MLRDDRFEMGMLMKEIMKNNEIREKGKEASAFANKVFSELKKMSKSDIENAVAALNLSEMDYLKNASPFIEREFNAKLEIIRADKRDIYDPANKARYSMPLKPAIYIE